MLYSTSKPSPPQSLEQGMCHVWHIFLFHCLSSLPFNPNSFPPVLHQTQETRHRGRVSCVHTYSTSMLSPPTIPPSQTRQHAFSTYLAPPLDLNSHPPPAKHEKRNLCVMFLMSMLFSSTQTPKTLPMFWVADHHPSVTHRRQETHLYRWFLVFGGSPWPSLGPDMKYMFCVWNSGSTCLPKTENVPSLAHFLGSGMSPPATKLEKHDTWLHSFMFGVFFPPF